LPLVCFAAFISNSFSFLYAYRVVAEGKVVIVVVVVVAAAAAAGFIFG
jgi:hypothetical protein